MLELTTTKIQYPVQDLKQQADRLFAVQPEVMDGAFYESDQEYFSVEEAKQKIQQFMKAKVM